MFDSEFPARIRIFYANCLWAGVRLGVNGDGYLVANGPAAIVETLKPEIAKRRDLLLAMLTPAPPAELERFFGRLIRREEVEEAQQAANQLGARIHATPVDHGWILEMSCSNHD